VAVSWASLQAASGSAIAAIDIASISFLRMVGPSKCCCTNAADRQTFINRAMKFT
jgi:hypothetical protein